MQVELELSLPHTPASGTEARTHPSSLKREREGGPRLGESSQDTCVGSQETTTMEKKRVHRNSPALGAGTWGHCREERSLTAGEGLCP